MEKNSHKGPRNLYIEKVKSVSDPKEDVKLKSTIDFTLDIQANSSALECPRDEHPALTCESKVTRLKKWQNVSVKGIAFNALIHHYFFNRLMAFPLPLMVAFKDEMSFSTSKDFSTDQTLNKHLRQLF